MTGKSFRVTHRSDSSLPVYLAVASTEVLDIFEAAGLKKPDISILSDQFLAEVHELPQKNLAVELLKKLLLGEIKTRSRRNVVQARLFSDLLEKAIRKYQNRAVETAQVIEELIGLAKHMREEQNRGAVLGLNEDEVAFYDALETNDNNEHCHCLSLCDLLLLRIMSNAWDQHGLAVHRAHGTACQDGIFHQARYHASSPQGRTTMVRTVRGKAFLCNEPSSTHWQCERCPSGTGQLACGRNEGVHQAER
jgi:Domain of unknown function (DUF3387)